ncbi:uncharacterized protein FFFS_15187 [Fusarium fujikuroi]|nr:uncharacterized protein FFFS_15187 [Fusarium fujikuroi]
MSLAQHEGTGILGIQPPKSQALLPPLPMTLFNPSSVSKTAIGFPTRFP